MALVSQSLLEVILRARVRGICPPQQPEQAPDVVSQGGDPLSDRPDAIEPQGIDGQAAEGGQDLGAVVLPVAVSVFPQRHIPHPVPAVLD